MRDAIARALLHLLILLAVAAGVVFICHLAGIGMPTRFVNPIAFLLLPILPITVLLSAKSLAGLTGFRYHMSLALRLIILLLLIFALAETHAVRRNDQLCVFYLLDWSKSVPASLRKAALQYINERTKAEMAEKDRAGLIVFGGDASIETPPEMNLKVDDIYSVVSTDHTDLSRALRLALAAFPEDSQKRVVLISDGNENQGMGLEEARNAKACGARVDVLPLTFERRQEALVDKVIVPNEVQQQEPFQVRIVVKAYQPCEAKLRLYENGQLVATQDTTLVGTGDGKSIKETFQFRRSLEQSGFYSYEAVLECEQDTIAENNRAYGYTLIRGEPRILYVEGDAGQTEHLAEALAQEGLDVDVKDANELPATLAGMQSYDCLILSNVPAHVLSMDQMQIIESNVRDLGIGLIMVGGEDSFGAGGYLNTPVERVLPVDMDVSQKKVLPKGALVIALDAAEAPEGNRWAKEMSRAAILTLSKRDEAGLIRSGGWLIRLQPVRDRVGMLRAIDGMVVHDCNDFDGMLRSALGALEKSTASVKHVVLMSDAGYGYQIDPHLLGRLQKAKVTVSTVVYRPHTTSAARCMAAVAARADGSFYFVDNLAKLPRIFTKEAQVVKRSLIWEEPFAPRTAFRPEMLKGIGPELPPLNGYVITTAKPDPQVQVPLLAKENDPLLAFWQIGLGRAGAFTSGAKTRWAKQWVSWGGYSKFWSQLVRWTARKVSRSNLQVATKVTDGEGQIILDALDAECRFLNFLDLKARAVSPQCESQPVQLRQTAPGRYVGRFDADAVGCYLVSIGYRGEGGVQGTYTTGAAVSYSPEYRELSTNQPLLENLAAAAGGRVLSPADAVFKHEAGVPMSAKPIWSALLLIAICLFPADVFVRRVRLDYAKAAAFAMSLLRVRRRKPERAADPRLAKLLARKAELLEQVEPRSEAPDAGWPSEPARDDIEIGLAPEPQARQAAAVTADEERTTVKQARASSPTLQRLLAAKKRALEEQE